MSANTETRRQGLKRAMAAAAIVGVLLGVPAAANGQSDDDSRSDRRERRFDGGKKFEGRRFDGGKKFDDESDGRGFDLRIGDVRFRDRGRPILLIRGDGFDRRTRVAIFGEEVRDVRFVSRGFLIADLSRFDRRDFDKRGTVVTVFDGGRRARSVVRF
jgi:hypothetical protein